LRPTTKIFFEQVGEFSSYSRNQQLKPRIEIYCAFPREVLDSVTGVKRQYFLPRLRSFLFEY